MLLRSCMLPFFVVVPETSENAQIQRKQITMKQENNINFFFVHSLVGSFICSIRQKPFLEFCLLRVVFAFAKFLHPIWWRNISCMQRLCCRIKGSNSLPFGAFSRNKTKRRKTGKNPNVTMRTHTCTHSLSQVSHSNWTGSFANDPNKQEIALSLFKAWNNVEHHKTDIFAFILVWNEIEMRMPQQWHLLQQQ